MKPTARRRALLYALSALLLGGLVEGAAWVVENALATRGVVYHPPEVGDYEAYLGQRDPLLGWPMRGPDPRRDASGSRIVPAAPDPAQPACLSLYGDSFTFGHEVEADAAWGNLLAQRLDCRVSNFGVNGYGTDQALLRFETNRADRAPVALLGHMSENIARNVNRFRGFVLPTASPGLKPRFTLGADGALQLLPLPDLTRAEYERMLRDPAAVLSDEALLPGTRYGAVWGGFPHTLTVLSTLGSHRILSYLRGGAYWRELYRADHPSRALDVTAAIIARFVRRAEQRERRGLVLLFPTRADLLSRRAGEPWPYEPLREALQRQGIEVLDVGEAILAARPADDPARLFTDDTFHFNEAGNRLVADAVEQFLRTRANWPDARDGDTR